ncbi:MAG: carboxypeptidase regulatory-like domain-containing protein [Terriglobia bacterium]
MIKKQLIVVAFLTLCAGISFGQGYRGTVQGVITDSNQAAIPGALVTLTNVNTGVSAARRSNHLGIYRFDFVEPGSYKMTAVAKGFATSIREKVLVQVQGDVAVNLILQLGRVSQSVTVTANPVELQFNSTTKDLTVTHTQLTQLPFEQRNPYTAALLDPAVVNAYPGTAAPYHMWQATEMDFGGQTSRQNDVLIDGSSVAIGPKGSYTPTIEGVQEVVVEQVAVDAEYGHSAGGIINIETPQGTNNLHGSAYYYGINPSFNAVTNAFTRTPSVSRSNIWGGAAGGPIKKNKVFTYFDYEGRLLSSPNTVVMTLPTAAERQGDYSRSLNIGGDLRTIYNPFSTVFNPATGVATRTPFPNNIIPQNMLDPTALKMMSYIWQPNTPAANVAGADNFRSSVGLQTHYCNFSDRTDWNINDKLKTFARYSQFHALNALPDYTGINSPAESNGQGGVMLAKSLNGDVVYTLNPLTVLNLRFGYASMNDDAVVPNMTASEFAGLWPGNSWYQAYQDQWGGKILFPFLNIGGNAFGEQYLYFQHPHSYTFTGKVVRAQGRHSLKAGLETRRQAAFASLPTNSTFNFGAATTSSTFINPNTSLSGDPYAAFLLGAPADSSYTSYTTPAQVSDYYYGAYVQDDFKMSRRITFNLGLRYEYESAPVDVQNRYTRTVDLQTANPTLQANPPQYTAQEIALRSQYLGSSAATPAPNGNWLFANGNNRTQFNAPGFNLEPRAGIAIRLNDKTVLLAGYGRFLELNSEIQNGLLADDRYMFAGYNATSSILPSQEGVPVTSLANPFPSNNPLQPPLGNRLGANTNLGNGFGDNYGDGFRYPNYKDGRLDRLNLTVERELPGKIRLDVSFVATNGRNLDSYGWYDSFPANEANPSLYYNPTTGPAMLSQYPNPFYQYLTPAQFPGALRNQKTVPLYQLLRPYPQYQELYTSHAPVEGDNVRNLEVRVQRSYANGMQLLASYIYNREQSTWWPDAGDFTDGPYYYNQAPMWTEGRYPRHRAIVSGIYALPVGHGRRWLTHANPLLDGLLGGWSSSSIFSITSGQPLNFGYGNPFVLTGSPTQNVPQGYAFNPAAFANSPAYTPFAGPSVIPGVDGPVQWDIDAQLTKSFPLPHEMNLQFRVEAYNLTNSIMFAPADSGFGDSTFGQMNLGQSNLGRTIQYSLRFSF